MFKDSFVNGPQCFAKGKKKTSLKIIPYPAKTIKDLF